MEKILKNNALVELLNYCKESGIDPSGTHILKYPRKYMYSLIKDDGSTVATVHYYKDRPAVYSHA